MRGSTGNSSDQRAKMAPLVDSNLLRFLAKQKKQIGVPTIELDATGDSSRRRDSEAIGERPKAKQQVSLSKNSYSRPINPTLSYLGNLNENISFGQYNAHRIARELIAIGADEEQGKNAGTAVQDYVLSRIMRRRIRQFLRERDILWTNGEQSNEIDRNRSRRQDMDTLKSLEKEIDTSKIEDVRAGKVIEVMCEYGLTGKDIATIFEHTPSIAMMTARTPKIIADDARVPGDEGFTERLSKMFTDRLNDETSESGNSQMDTEQKLKPKESVGTETVEDILKQSFAGLLCKTLKLRKYDARKVLRACPGLLSIKGSNAAEQVVKLMSSLGVSTSSLARDKKALPVILSRSPASLFRLVAFLSSDAVRMPLDKIGPLLRRAECVDILNAVAPIPQQGLNLTLGSTVVDGNSINSKSVLSILGRSSGDRREQIDSIYAVMASTAIFLRQEVGINDLDRIISAYPNVLLLDGPTQVIPICVFLVDKIGIWQEDMPRVLETFPAILGGDLSKMEEIAAYLLSLEVAEESLSSIIRAFPSTLFLDIQTHIGPVVDFLRKIGVENIGRFITRLPPVLGYSVDDELIPKWNYISRTCDFSYYEVVRFPAFFSYPLDRVIMSRYQYLIDVKRIPPTLVGIDEALRFGDKDFATRVAGDTDGGVAFSKFLKERKKQQARETKRKAYQSRYNNGGRNRSTTADSKTIEISDSPESNIDR